MTLSEERLRDEELVNQLRRLVDDQEGGDAVVLVQRQMFNRVVGRLHALSLRSDAHTSGEVKVGDWVSASRAFLSADDFEAIQSLASAFAVDRVAGVNSQLKPAGQS